MTELHVTITGVTDSGASMSGAVVSMGPRGAIVETQLGRRTIYREGARVFCRALGGVIDWDIAREALSRDHKSN